MRRVNYVEHEEHLQEPAHVRRRLGAFHGGGGRGRGFARRGARPEQRKGTCEKNLCQETSASGDPGHHSHGAHLFGSFAESPSRDRPKNDRAEHRTSSYAERKTGPSARLEQDEAEAASTGVPNPRGLFLQEIGNKGWYMRVRGWRNYVKLRKSENVAKGVVSRGSSRPVQNDQRNCRKIFERVLAKGFMETIMKSMIFHDFCVFGVSRWGYPFCDFVVIQAPA